jgi:hypothetical protein
VQPEGLGKFEKIHLIGTRSHDLLACSIVPQPLRYRVPHLAKSINDEFIIMQLSPASYHHNNKSILYDCQTDVFAL